MDYLPKLFAEKFNAKHQHAFFKLLGLMLLIFILSQLANGFSQFLSEIIFFTGFAVVQVVMMGFASVNYFNKSKISKGPLPFLTPLYANPIFCTIKETCKRLYHTLFLMIFHAFLLTACLTALFPILARVFNS
ncbi:hypothetical protein J8M20_07140 [Pseudoalteromonas luteoviolacea]|uniref:hypothetical protein n=1 Tax=Pseudoalteromonas luteoviolacea TaxID=43657 RepID=UPI001B38475D|nr:hypothetical protein [Pseudoalteromonas luteoviolacea]MBQ4811105.1 hypothetical protein [Pseudoalteromonas luteoviolacea]